MRVHHLSCGTLCPVGSRGITGDGGWLDRTKLVCHCLVLETSDGLVVVDSGFGTEDVSDPDGRLGRPFRLLNGYAPRMEDTLLRQIEALGFHAADVRHIALTHLDLDHAGGIADFPNAKIHLHTREKEAAMQRRRLVDQQRYQPKQWAHGPAWVTYEGGGETWEGFSNVRRLDGPSEDVLLVPLFGHTEGHAGIVVPSADGLRSILHAGDAYFSRHEVAADRFCPPFLSVFQGIIAADDAGRLENQRKLRELALKNGGKVDVICAHDAAYFERFSHPSAPG